MAIKRIQDLDIKDKPPFINGNTHYQTIMGSVAYGVSDDFSDVDIYGWAIPPKRYVFPHTEGYIAGFSKDTPKFEQYVNHGYKLDSSGQVYDFSIFSIVKYVRLLADNNPNIIDSIFTPRNCVIQSTSCSEHLRENRKLFLHKGLWHKFKGYSYSQLHKAKSKNPTGKRLEIREKYGMDVKFLYHVVRLLSECEQMLETGDLDLQEKGRREHMKAIRRGDVSQEDIERWAQDKEKKLENLYANCSLPYTCDEEKIKTILLECLEMHYGSIDNCVQVDPNIDSMLEDLENVIRKYKK